MNLAIVFATICIVGGLLYVAATTSKTSSRSYDPTILTQTKSQEGTTVVTKSEDQWKKQLTDEQYYITRQKGTERAFTGKYWNNHEKGKYTCVCCGAELFSSDTKYESGSGWPSFYRPEDPNAVAEHSDNTLGMRRVEIACSKCGAHLGHVFDDGPQPTGLRYCVNSASLDFKKSADSAKDSTLEAGDSK